MIELLGDNISKGQGAHRDVFLHKYDYRFVVKVTKGHKPLKHAKQEVMNWLNASDKTRKFLAPIIAYSNDYRFVVMAKIELGYERPDVIPECLNVLTDIKKGHEKEKIHWGKYKDRIVLCDYGLHLL
jgi:hypothetical protein